MGTRTAADVERQRQSQPNQPVNRVTQYQQLLEQQQRQQQQRRQQVQRQQTGRQQAQSQWATASQQSAAAISRGQDLNGGRLGYQQARTGAYNQGFMAQTLGQAQHQIAAVRHRRAQAQLLAATQAPNPLATYPSESMTAAVAAAVAMTGAHNLRPMIASPQLSVAAASATATAGATPDIPAFASTFSSTPVSNDSASASASAFPYTSGSAAAAGPPSQMQGHNQLQAQGHVKRPA